MNIFEFRDNLVDDYVQYFSSFIRIRDEVISAKVKGELDRGLLWPSPLIQINPSFEQGKSIDDLVSERILHETCSKIFRSGKTDSYGAGKVLKLHKHQEDAIRVAHEGNNYVLTTGTGSGKSLAYIIPIVDHILKSGSGKGTKALIIYPMNALANSQMNELDKFINEGFPDNKGPVTFKRYTGQEDDEARNEIKQNPPDILLTNYVMLEYILTRTEDQAVIKNSQDLRFFVLDELHTFRGRQGADVSMLVRRVRNILNADRMQCIGTSATLASEGTYDEQQEEVARVASTIFGTQVKPEHVIGETLRRSTQETDIEESSFITKLTARVSNYTPPETFEEFLKDPLTIWIESNFGVHFDAEANRLVRVDPMPIRGKIGAAEKLGQRTGLPVDKCADSLEKALMTGYRLYKEADGKSVPFAFRLHQFLSRGDSVYASLEDPAERILTLHGQQYVPGDKDKVLLPLVFCRECGQEYYCVRRKRNKEGIWEYQPREMSDTDSDDDSEAGYIFLSKTNPWSDDHETMMQKVPDDWLEEGPSGWRIKRSRRNNLPEPVKLDPCGMEDEEGIDCHFINAPFRFCMLCEVSYSFNQRSDFPKLNSFASGGRSTATTILSLSAIRNLRKEPELSRSARKLLSFTDNRQDASLQAGHFNDFVRIGLLRATLYKAALEAGDAGLSHDELTQKVFDNLGLELNEYASNPEVKFSALEHTNKALRDVLGYRLYRDLKHGWRITSPNLEQCGLLNIDYASLKELCAADEEWSTCHAILSGASPERRHNICKILLDHARRELALKVDYLDRRQQERMTQRSSQHLMYPWNIEENEEPRETGTDNLEYSRWIVPRSKKPRESGELTFLSSRSAFGRYLRKSDTFPEHTDMINLEETGEIIKQLFKVMTVAGLVEVVSEPRFEDDVPGYQVSASAIIWKAGDGTRAYEDPLRVTTSADHIRKPNEFFVEFYKTIANELKGLQANEHTAQVKSNVRQDRENRFREGELPILFCSPTMELGIDIKELNLVNLRNVPPTPANYAQRSGRAGRSGQPALVYTYCTTGSSHDQYFFNRKERMVSGKVQAPRIDLTNEDLIRSHIHSIWLSEAKLHLGKSLLEVLDVSGEEPSLTFKDEVKEKLTDDKIKKNAHLKAEEVLKSVHAELQSSDWYHDEWLHEVINNIDKQFDSACNRWRSLYRAAFDQHVKQNRIVRDASRPEKDRNRAKGLSAEAYNQMKLLESTGASFQSDFYTYRYFASEGFLPGYNFPRLPISAYIPGSTGKRGNEEYLNRPRFLAISEFGPGNFIYHEGSRYQIERTIITRQDDQIPTTRAKKCSKCGYLHHITEGDGADLCENCGAQLDNAMRDLFKLDNVVTKHRARISCDEEERTRQGYEIKTCYRFAKRDTGISSRIAIASSNGNDLLKLTYGHAATLWRLNLGWTRRSNSNLYGFNIDTERGKWQPREQADSADASSATLQRVIPYVEDSRNCLIIEPVTSMSEIQMTTLQAAFKKAIQIKYQVEDNELAAEPLPDSDNRRMILLYESAEGGAGVLRQLIEDPGAVASVAREALILCHYDPDTGENLGHGQSTDEDCTAACYDCLMSYSNQRDHRLLDRETIRKFLLELMNTTVKAAPGNIPRTEHLNQLKNLAGSDLELKWLDYIDELNLNLPTKAQVLIESCSTRPDFVYENSNCRAAIYIDGPHHDYPDRQERDKQQAECLEDLGYLVIRFKHHESWMEVIENSPSIFGRAKCHTQ